MPLKKMFVGNLPQDASENKLQELFSAYGTVRSVHISSDIFTGKCRGFGFVEMEGHEARAAVNGLNGISFNGNLIKVKFDRPGIKRKPRRRN